MPALLAASIEAKQHARGIQAAGAYVPHLRSAHPDIGTRLDCRKKRFQPMGMRCGIVIQNSQVS